jgi:hypothetical protein
MNMKNMRETVNNALIIGGLVTSGAATIDSVRDGALSRVTREEARISNELRDEFGVTKSYWLEGVSWDVIPDAKNRCEEKTQLKEFYIRMSEETKKIPDEDRVNRDSKIALAGTIIASIGLFRKNDK